MTVFSAAASRDLALIIVVSIVGAIAVNIPNIVALVAIWVGS